MFGLLLATGCSSGGKSVSGKVTVDGTPLKTGSVRFVPDKTKGNTSTKEAVGVITDGSYTMGVDGKTAVPPGWYKVAVISAEPLDSSKPNAPAKSYIAPKYNDPETSGLTVEVGSGSYDLKVTAN